MRKLQFQGQIAVLEVTSLGYKKLREAVRMEQTTLKGFIELTVSQMGGEK